MSIAWSGRVLSDRAVVDGAAYARGLNPIQFTFTGPENLIGREIQSGTALPGDSLHLRFVESAVYFGLNFDGRWLGLRQFPTAVWSAMGSCETHIRAIVQDPRLDRGWISDSVALLPRRTGQNILPLTIFSFDRLNFTALGTDEPTLTLTDLPAYIDRIHWYIDAEEGCELVADGLSFAHGAVLQPSVQTLDLRHGVARAQVAVHAVPTQASPSFVAAPDWSAWWFSPNAMPPVLRWLPLLSGIALWLAVVMKWPILAAKASVAGLLALLVIPATTLLVTQGAVLWFSAALAQIIVQRRQIASTLRKPPLRFLVSLCLILVVLSAASPSPVAALRYLGFALSQQVLLLWLLLPLLSALYAPKTAALLAATLFGLCHVPNLELALLCVALSYPAIRWYQKRGDFVTIVLAHAAIGTALALFPPNGMLYGLDVGWHYASLLG